MKKINKIYLLLFVLLAFSCDDILENNITDDTPSLISPINSQKIESNAVTFKWNDLVGADKYRIQIFNIDKTKILDSLIIKTNLVYPLSQGKYQWRVRGENSAYQSSYSLEEDFSVVESNDLSKQLIILKNPADNYYTKNNTITCNWENLIAANYYQFKLLNVTSGETIVYEETNIINPTLIISSANLSAEANYKWQIKGINETSATPYSTRTFSIDRTNPNQPSNTLPAQNARFPISQSINFTWSIPTDTGTIQSTISYTIEFSNDINFTTVIQKHDVSAATFDKAFTTIGDYYWRIKATDLAGNVGTYSIPFKFIIE